MIFIKYTKSIIDTPLGPMIAISDDKQLYILEFIDRPDLEKKIKKLHIQKASDIAPGSTNPIKSIKTELELYFSGQLKQFKTPTETLGSLFQQKTWRRLMNVPYGQTKSYLEQAIAVGNQKATRAVANANGANQLAIIIPCHRIINSNGKLGGYGGGINRKKWLIDHEKHYSLAQK